MSDGESWPVTATLLTNAVARPILSRLADMFGKRLMMIMFLVAMTAGSVLAALGGHFVTLFIGRSLQDFAAALIPIGISIMLDVVLPLSGIIFEQFGWEVIFWISAMAGVLLTVGVPGIVSESTVRTRGRFDYIGAALVSIALPHCCWESSRAAAGGGGSEQGIGLFELTVGS